MAEYRLFDADIYEAYLSDDETARAYPLTHLTEGYYLLGKCVARQEVMRALGLGEPTAALQEQMREHVEAFAEQVEEMLKGSADG